LLKKLFENGLSYTVAFPEWIPMESPVISAIIYQKASAINSLNAKANKRAAIPAHRAKAPV
jgi:hypothetical protein